MRAADTQPLTTRVLLWVTAPALCILPISASAHGFGRLYNLPVPFWLYAWGASAVLILSFLLAGLFLQSSAATKPNLKRDITNTAGVALLRRLLPALKLVSLSLLLLCLCTAYFGNRDPYRNFSMTFFWVIFLLGFAYLTAVIGNLYAAINPWQVLSNTIGKFFSRYTQGLFRYPSWLANWPALVFYLVFIWFELFGLGRPGQLAEWLLGYSLLNLVGVGLVGHCAWFRHCEFFSLMLRLIALLAPLQYQPAAEGQRARLYWTRPLAGLSTDKPESLSTVVFILAMLSTTAFDGLRATQWWVSLFWADPYGIVTAWWGSRPMLDYAGLRPWYIGWETFCLLLSPFLYFSIYLLSISLAKFITRSPHSIRNLALAFACPLLPIALVYHITHYSTLLLTQGPKIVSLTSDPFGWNWDLFGTAMLWRAPILPDIALVWHSQVGLILLGHILSVLAAHRVALDIMPSRKSAFLSQLPMLVLMVSFTIAGLWILAQPLTLERMS